MPSTIHRVHAREILDGRGMPTLEVDVELEGGAFGRAAVPGGAQAGPGGLVQVRDGDGGRYLGMGVTKAVKNVTMLIGPKIAGMDARDQAGIDETIAGLDGTPTRRRLGAGAILGVSLAVAKAAAARADLPLYRYLGGAAARVLPVPMCTVLGGGSGNADLRELLVVPMGAPSFSEGLRIAAEVFQALRAVLERKGLSAGVGDAGGFSPTLAGGDAEAMRLVLRAVKAAGHKAGKDVGLAVGAEAGRPGRGGRNVPPGAKRKPADDDTGVLVRIDQAATLTETLAAIDAARRAGRAVVIGYSPGETEDTTIADLAVATGAGRIRTGGLGGSSGAAKCNRLLRIEEELGDSALYGDFL